jgi:hypothetical protein
VVDSPFSSKQYYGTYPSISGEINPVFTVGIDNVQYDEFTVQAFPLAMTSMVPLAAPSGWQLDLIAGTNPSRPVSNIPELVQDIVQLPKMVKSLGDAILNPASKMSPKGLAGEYLGVQFGWLPLIDDLRKLLNVQHDVIKRCKELNQLYSGKGLRRRLKFADDTAMTNVNCITTVNTSTITQACSLDIKRETWGTVRWKPVTPPPYHPHDGSQNAFARNLVLGATPEGLANGLWKVIPWTWLLGWFSNIGKFTLAYSGTVPAEHGICNFMSMATATYRGGGVTATNVTKNTLVSGGVAIFQYKTRAVSAVVSPGANMPFIDMFRLSILGSLFAQRFL